jgi:hypothetical protein
MRVRNAVGMALALALLAPAASRLNAQAPTSALKKMAPPIRGVAEVGYTQSAKLEGNTIVTVFEVKNLSATGSIVGLQVSEFWYDRPGGNLLQGTGDRQRLRMPLGPGEVATITLKSPKVAGMTKESKPQYKFAQQNGDVKLKAMKSLK